MISTSDVVIEYKNLNDCITTNSDSDYAGDVDTESVFFAAVVAAKEAICLRLLTSELGCCNKNSTYIFVDNQSAIGVASNPEFHKRS